MKEQIIDKGLAILSRAKTTEHVEAPPLEPDPESPRLLPVQTNLANANANAATPRSSSSVEIQQSPRSPFLQNLHQRLRKGSIASSSVSSSDAVASNASTESVDKAEAARAAKRFLLATIRNDWEWPETPKETRPELQEAAKRKDEAMAAREPVTWRTREEGPSDADMDSDDSMSGKRKRKMSDPYRFENPDSIASSVLDRKLKRQKKIEDEMQWNHALKLWSDRRDAWTGAVRSIPARQRLSSPTPSSAAVDNKKKRSISASKTGRPNLDVQPSQYDSNSNGADDEDSAEQGSSRKGLSSITDSPSTSSFPHSASTTASTVDPDPNGPYLPVLPPLFPVSHTLRSRIKPPAYPTIYSKVVVQSLTPNVPIPLTHMIGALVDGWKSEGNWPPQAAAQEAAASLQQKRRSKGDSAFSRWRREQDEKRRLRRVTAGGQADAHGHGIMKDIIPVEEGEIEKRGFRRSLTGAVKKVFGFQDVHEDSDGGLERMGVRFLDEQELEDQSDDIPGVQGLMKEARAAMDDNIALNRALVDGD